MYENPGGEHGPLLPTPMRALMPGYRTEAETRALMLACRVL